MEADLINAILSKRKQIPVERSLLVGISGIDASGKGFVAGRLAKELENKGVGVANINVDGWLNLPHVRFSDEDHGRHFYENALRLDEMFNELILPLRQTRSVSLTMDLAEETATEFRQHRYEFRDIDAILLEGIFIFKKQFVQQFDLRIWVECPFDVALTRAVERSQEGLSPDETIAAYENIYFPAQRLHLKQDDPKAAAEILLENRLTLI
jgi:uridine kinase